MSFLYFAVLEMFSSERAPKMLKNEVLDVQKLADTAENEPLQVPEIWKTVGLWVHYGCSASSAISWFRIRSRLSRSSLLF